MTLVKSKQRVADHGEVFTPAWMVEAMLDLVKDETERIDSKFLEPACGSGNFLVPVLRRKLAAVELKYGQSDFERRHFALHALMRIYGIELLEDNVAECRASLLEIFAGSLNLQQGDALYRAASYVLTVNIIRGDAMKMKTHDDRPLIFASWGYIGKGKFERNDFRLDELTSDEDGLKKLEVELQSRIDLQTKELNSVIASRAEDRMKLAPQIDSELVALYEKIRGNADGVGAALLIGNKCDGCHMVITAVELDKIKGLPDDEVCRCEECRRILVRI